MKKLIAGIIAFTLFSTSLFGTALATPSPTEMPEIAVLLDGRKIQFPDEKPQVDSSSRILIPVRFVSEALGAKVDFAGKDVIITKSGKTIRLTIGSNVVTVNGVKKTLDTKAIASNGRTLVPLRFVSEALEQKVEWDKVGRWVWIGEKNVPRLEDAGLKVVDINDVKSMIGVQEHIWSVGGVDATEATIFSITDLPLEIGGTIIYDIWSTKENNKVLLHVRYKGQYSGIYFLTDKKSESARYRQTMGRQANQDGTGTLTYNLLMPADEILHEMDNRNFTLQSPLYIGFDWERGGMKTIALMHNPWKG